MNGGIGDMLLLTIITRHLHENGRGENRVFTHYPEIFESNPTISKVFDKESLTFRMAKLLCKDYHEITYRCWSTLLPHQKSIFDCHVIEQFCHQLSIRGKLQLKPALFLTRRELEQVEIPTGKYLVVQSQASHSNHPQSTKDWPAQRMQEVVDALKPTYRIVQLGSKQDHPLKGVDLMLGKTSIREAAILLKSAACFIGLEGALMHLARAVDCSSVVIWGGRLQPSQIGYPCFENLYQKMDCSPCWIPNACPHGLACMDSITSDMVLERIDKIISQAPQPLPVDEIIVKDTVHRSEIKKQILEFPPHLDHLVSKVA